MIYKDTSFICFGPLGDDGGVHVEQSSLKNGAKPEVLPI